MTLAALHKTKFGPGNWPATCNDHDVMDAMFDIADAETNSDPQMHSAFHRHQCGFDKPRANAMRHFMPKIFWSGVKNKIAHLSHHQQELLAYAIIKQWIEADYAEAMK
jgi:hypothetical protein